MYLLAIFYVHKPCYSAARLLPPNHLNEEKRKSAPLFPPPLYFVSCISHKQDPQARDSIASVLAKIQNISALLMSEHVQSVLLSFHISLVHKSEMIL